MPLQRSRVCNTDIEDKANVPMKDDHIIAPPPLIWLLLSMWKFSGHALKTPLLPCHHLSQLLHPCAKKRSNGMYNICIWRAIHQTGRCQFLPSFPMTAVFILRVISFQISLSWVVYWQQARKQASKHMSLVLVVLFTYWFSTNTWRGQEP